VNAVAVDTPTEDIKPWELHSELVLVCPEVLIRALQELPERDPDAFLKRRPRPIRLASDHADAPELAPGLAAAACRYALRRVVDTAQFAVVAIGCLVALASLAEVLH
jgi:hypothetical protein